MDKKRALLELAEFVYQAKVIGADRRILDLMDMSDDAFKDCLKTLGLLEHEDLAKLVEKERQGR